MALRAGRVGINPADVNPIDGHISSNYKEGKYIIGTWIDGKPIYRKVIIANTPGVSGGAVDESINSLEHEVISINGIFTTASGSQTPINTTTGSSYLISTYVTNQGLCCTIVGSAYFNRPACFIVDYFEKDSEDQISTLNEE